MEKIRIKFLETISYEQYESFAYLLSYDFEYEDIEEYVTKEEMIDLEIDDDEEDRADDLEVLSVLLAGFDREGVKYEIYGL